ncbi:sterol desaturase [Aureobasidium sp. EXF-10727]|nr:sterol desaturase [Aureobasidium sp. EXF-10727]KAI4729693.1 sterol desaturase [Aureobasidium sp. EXF-10728]
MTQLVQTLWSEVLQSTSPYKIELIGTLGIQFGAFWLPSLLLLGVDHVLPLFSLRHKIQSRPTPTSIQIWHCIDVVVVNQLFMAVAKMLELSGLHLVGRSSFYRFDHATPTVSEIARDLIICVFLCEIIFYYSHRLLHVKLFYQRIHNRHHQFKAPIALAAQYAHPIEYLVSTILPFWLPPQILGCHILTCFLFWTAATLETVIAHSGYDFFTVLAKKHDLHHEKSRVNFGTLGFLDWIHGTGA